MMPPQGTGGLATAMTHTETVQPCLRFNYVEFGTIKIRIHQPLPYSKELNGIAVAQPVREEEFTIFRLQHVCQADIVIFILLFLYRLILVVSYFYLCFSYLQNPKILPHEEIQEDHEGLGLGLAI